jgi:hypothetical protein
MNIDALLDDAIAMARADRDATTLNKASSASAASAPTGREKLSSLRERNEDFARLGVLVANLGEHGFQKMAMESMGTTLPAPKDASVVAAEIAASGTAAPSTSAGGVTQPTTFTATPGATGGPDFTPDASTTETGEKDLATKGPEGSIPEMTVEGSPAAQKSSAPLNISHDKAVALVKKVSGNLYLEEADADAVLNHFGMKGPEDVVVFLKRSADARGQGLVDFLVGAELHDAEKPELFAAFAKSSMHEGDYRSQLATAKEAVEAGIQATGALPTTQDIVRTTGVDPAVANTAQMQVAQTVVAAGGSVAAPGGVEAAPVDGAGTEPAAPPAAAAPAPAAAVPPAGAAAPVDPSMAATTDPNAAMAAPAKTAGAKIDDPVAALKALLDSYGTKVSEGPTMDREEPSTGDDSPKDAAVTDAAAPEGSATYEMTASERAIADALASNQSAADTTAADTDAMKADDIAGRVDTAVSAPSTDADMTASTDEISGTMEGSMDDSGEGTSGTSVDKESDDFVSRIRQVAAESLRKASSSIMVATGGRGSNEVVGGSQVFTGGPSESMSGSVKKAYKYARQVIEDEGVPPEVTDVMKATGVQLDDAKTGIYHASNG